MSPEMTLNQLGSPLSYAQKRAWLLQQLHPHTPFVESVGIQISGQIEQTKLRRACSAALPLLRQLGATIKVVDHIPYRSVSKERPLEIVEVDLSTLPENEQEAAVRQLVMARCYSLVDLTRPSLFQIILAQLADERHVLILLAHQSLLDRSSLLILLRRITSYYNQGTSLSISPLLEPYARQADSSEKISMYESLAGVEELIQESNHEGQFGAFADELDYWQKRLGADLPNLELPFGKSRAAYQTFDGAKHLIKFPSDLVDRLAQFVQKASKSHSVVLLSAFKALLYRYSKQTDIIVGTTLDNGDADGDSQTQANLLDTCQNLLALRTDLSNNPSFYELLERVSLTQQEAFANRNIPFELLLSKLTLTPDTSRPPVFQVMFDFSADPLLSIPDVSVRQIDVDYQVALYDITLYVRQVDTGLEGYFEYNTTLFDSDTIARVAEHFFTLIDSGLATPEKKINELTLLSQQEQHRIRTEWNRTAVALPASPLLHQLFEQQAKATPERIAVEFENRRWTYGELDQKASILARYLQERGVGSGLLVGIYMERSLEMMLALLAVLKAGGGYVPLDPAFPQDRLAYMVVDSELVLLLTQRHHVEQIFEHQAQLICVDDQWPEIEQLALQRPELAADEKQPAPSDLAYVIYTSGSTGKPKGVQIPHIAACNFLLTMKERPGIEASDVLVAVTTLSFDIALLELFLPLTVGGKVVIASRNVAADAAQLLQMMNEVGVTVMQATPATWRMLVDIGWAGTNGLKALCGGEPFPIDLAERMLDRCGSVWNMYGPTETTVWSTIHPVTALDSPISIGRPIANTEIYILDEALHLVPIGVPGVLYIGGAGLARGYLNRPELTAEKFVTHPFLGDKNARIYNTGDMARYRPDGTIECLGRIDHQVKIRGFRIELGEIESVLSKFPGVRQTVVIAREDAPGAKMLTAYLVMVDDSEPSIRDLRAFLKVDLPEYMIPSYFVTLTEMPLTPNGKVNRLVLPAPDGNHSRQEGALVLPRDKVEEDLMGLWKELLNVSHFGVHDEFFELGGTSIVAVRLFARIEQMFGVKLPLATLFTAPSVAQLAELIRDPDHSEEWSCLVKIREGSEPAQPPIFLFHGAGGAVLLYRELANQLDPTVTVYGLQSLGLNNAYAPQRTIEEMALQYASEIEKVQPNGPYQFAGYCMGGSIALEVAQRFRSHGHEVAMLVLLETYNWANLEAESFADKIQHQLEKIAFHLLNLALSDAKGRRAFLKGKLDETLRRVKMTIHDRKVRKGSADPNGLQMTNSREPFVTATEIWAINDEASLLYQPKEYAGRIVHIVARKQYAKYDKPWLGWTLIATEKVDVCVLNVYPAGMLVEPFVFELATELNKRLVKLPIRDVETIQYKKDDLHVIEQLR